MQNHSSIIVYTTSNSSYSSILQSSIRNLRFTSPSTPKPLFIITPILESQIPTIVSCTKQNKMQIRTRSGGHDYEGLSYTSQVPSQVPFIVVDLINLSEIKIDVDGKTAWVQSGATIGQLYYEISQKSQTLAFPAGTCPTIGIGGHISGGGYGALLRKYGLAADNVIDARLVDARGRILDRKSMGEELFWAIRGGGGASFGVILAWKVKLVEVPEKVTVFAVARTLEQNATQLVHRWQSIAHRFHRDLFVRIIIVRANSNRSGGNFTINALFHSVFLGGVDRLIPMMRESFPELGLVRDDCTEMSWIQSVLSFAGIPIDSREVLLNRTQPGIVYFKIKSDYVREPIPVYGLEGVWRLFYEAEGGEGIMILTPYGGMMDEISESEIPFPHRAGNLYKIQHQVYWQDSEAGSSDRHLSWIRRLYSYMATYVSRAPREAFLNYRDLDIGVNSNGKNSYLEGGVYGVKYFKGNYNRLVKIKTKVDPGNFFRNEQSIPVLPWRK
ncbi:cannabidiolic acid synthase-like 1 [Phtheirospermum japonicum]|uniref:Cannabidiolic acid synthase-like 1 n=1 Tax=Phtheirospermum japonicum TaxID=374723 RepID=A0A830CLG9_9LAMI|nr:cannabidiolic acid synthase-like 1 [Phtheirospermum japonicum]